MKKIVDLGFTNGWMQRPKIVASCNEARLKGEKHDRETKLLGKKLNQITCRTCGFKYKVDSSD